MIVGLLEPVPLPFRQPQLVGVRFFARYESEFLAFTFATLDGVALLACASKGQADGGVGAAVHAMNLLSSTDCLRSSDVCTD